MSEDQLEKDIRETTIHLLIKQAQLDQRLEEIEVIYIRAVAQEYGIEVNRVIELEDPKNFNFCLPKEENARMAILYHLLFLSKKDRTIEASEIDFIYKMALALGIRDDIAGDLIEVMKRHIGLAVPAEALLDVFKPYLN